MVMAAEADTAHVMPAAFSLSQEQLNDILRSGGGRRDSRKRIYAKLHGIHFKRYGSKWNVI